MEKFDKAKTVCFSGHRPEKLPGGGDPSAEITRILKSLLYKEIEDCVAAGYNTFITGLARGVDLWVGEIVMELKVKNPSLNLIAAAPYRDHGSSFRGKDRFILGNILLKADEVVYVSEAYTKECMRIRNEFMVDNAGKLIAVVANYKSGTGQTIRYAQKRGIDVKIIDAAKLANDIGKYIT